MDFGDFVILGSDDRTTEVNGRVDEWEFVKHIQITDTVYAVYAGDNTLAKKYFENLKGMVRRIPNREVEYVAEVASKLLEKTCLVDHLWNEEKKSEKERLPLNKRTEQNVPLVLHIILVGKSASGEFHVYSFEDVNGDLYSPKKVNAAFGGSGMKYAKDYITDHMMDQMLTQADASDLVMKAIEDATHQDWRSGGRIHLLIFQKNKHPIRIVYSQEDRKKCKCPYVLSELEDFEVRCHLKATPYPIDWQLEDFERQIVKLKRRLTTDFE